MTFPAFLVGDLQSKSFVVELGRFMWSTLRGLTERSKENV